MTVVGYVPGGFDLFHIGHLNVLRAARERCDYLIAGVATDESLEAMKNRSPVIPFSERLDIVANLRLVDRAVADHSQDKRLAWHDNRFDVLFKGDDWQGTVKGLLLEQEMAEVGAQVVYFPYTARTSSTSLREFIHAANTAARL
ncbi:adenylyltransferase/cytidyltransferase family protein [Pseudactinotalea sp. Z1739]|uniref:adenylyltransferase/cytidyltransferase family protein n=1 Tax=Pseudactinotalea sp. Z1739 TaxID=3413028 RepID=UPI003C79E733